MKKHRRLAQFLCRKAFKNNFRVFVDADTIVHNIHFDAVVQQRQLFAKVYQTHFSTVVEDNRQCTAIETVRHFFS